MSVKHVGLVLEHFNGKPALKLVAVILADHADQDGVCWPSYRRIAEMTSQSERQVARHVKELIELGIVTKLRTGTIVKQDGKSVRLSNAYRLNAHVIEGRRTLKLSPDSLLVSSQNVYLEHDKNVRSRWTSVSTKPSFNHHSNHHSSKPVDKSQSKPKGEPATLTDVLAALMGEDE